MKKVFISTRKKPVLVLILKFVGCFFIYFCDALYCRYVFKAVSDVPAKPFCFTQRFLDVKKTLSYTFFGPPKAGVYSPSVQNTLYLMGEAVLFR